MKTEAQKRATAKYNKKTYIGIHLRIRKDGDLTREAIQARAREYGMSMAEYITELIKKDMGM